MSTKYYNTGQTVNPKVRKNVAFSGKGGGNGPRREYSLTSFSLSVGHDKTFYVLLIWNRAVLESITRSGVVSLWKGEIGCVVVRVGQD